MNTRACRMLIVAAGSVIAVAPLAAQADGVGVTSSTFRPGLGYAYETGSSLAMPGRSWIRSVVLWRWQPDRMHATSEDSAAARRALLLYRQERDAAQDSGRLLAGANMDGIVYAASVDRDGTLHVLGRRYVVPSRDSALVVMVDQSGAQGAAPRIVGTAYIGANMPDAFWSHSWTRGDTTLSIFPRNSSALLLAALEKAPAVAAFIHSTEVRDSEHR